MRALRNDATGTAGRTAIPVFVVAEEVDAPDEGYAKVVIELSRALSHHGPVATHVTRVPGTGHKGRRGLQRMRAILNRSLWSELRRSRPSKVVYMSRSSLTLSALVRSRFLKLMSGRTRVVMVALQRRQLSRRSRFMARLLWPDLLLVSTDDELRSIRSLGGSAERMVTGVDLDRFRPARRGEKAALRRKWQVPVEAQVVLHVGHLTGGRNLEALLELTGRPGVTVVVVASRQREAESALLERRLREAGVVLITGLLPEIDEVYRLADCYVFPTVSSANAIAMPLSILEAIATDLPVVAMRFGALPERFGDVQGVVLVNSTQQMVEAVHGLLSHPASTRRLSEGFSWAAVADQVAGA